MELGQKLTKSADALGAGFVLRDDGNPGMGCWGCGH